MHTESTSEAWIITKIYCYLLLLLVNKYFLSWQRKRQPIRRRYWTFLPADTDFNKEIPW